ncbi:MAG: SGNH/GDSL hydrolase family protein [Polyangiaceae bacterium]|nr:SGNH/GDSL hydrolase family protein [Polyangiaceae bacterium]
MALLAGKWGYRMRLTAASVVIFMGFDAPLFGYWMLPAAFFLIVTGTTWVIRLLILPAPGETEVPPRRRQIALLVGTSVLMLVILLGMSTTVRFRLEDHRYRPPWQGGPMASQIYDPELGWSPYGPPDVIGQRLERVDLSRERVLLMGDSIFFGPSLTDEEQVGKRLEARLAGYQVINASVSGYSIDQYWLTLKKILPIVKPRVLVVGIFTGNDFQISSREMGFGNHKPLLRWDGEKLVRADVAGPCIDRLSRSILMRVLWQNRELAASTIASICRPATLSRSEAEKSISAMFAAIDALAAEVGSRVLYMLLPVDGELQTMALDRYLYLSRHFDLYQLLVQGKHEWVDFSAELFKSGNARSPLFLEDHAHFGPAGHDLMAEVIHREIQARKMLP